MLRSVIVQQPWAYSGGYVPSSSPSTNTVTASGTDSLGLTGERDV